MSSIDHIQLENYHAGHFRQGHGFKYFMPSKINAQWQWQSPEINNLLEKAAVRLGELNSFAKLVPNIHLFIQLHVTKESVVSSRIEGTQTNIDEALMPEEEISPERREDWREVQNYSRALNVAIEQLKDLPISSRMLRNTHQILLSGVRGEHKMPGEYRSSQNWIGGNSLNDAVFIPPPHTAVHDLMGDLEKFLHNDDIHVPALIKMAIAHYQFETIHPFLDGNGRIGRLLITLFLVSEKILEKPLLYLSTYFERNKMLYYDNLTRVRTQNDMRQWLKYFLVGIEKTASQAVNALSEVIELKADLEDKLRAQMGRRTANAQLVLNELFSRPVVAVDDIQKLCDTSYKTANDLVAGFVKQGLLVEITGQSRNRIFRFEPYLKIFKKDELI